MTTETSVTLVPGGAVETLHRGTLKNWTKATHHRFVEELFEGSIDNEVLASYLVQDYQFFDAFLSMLGACVAFADNAQAKLRFAQQLGFLAADEDGYFEYSFEALGVSKQDRISPELTKTTAAFQQMMYDAAESQSYPKLLVMLVIAEWLYLDWGSRADQLEKLPKKYLHSGWIDLHRGADFTAWSQFLIDELERVYPKGPENQLYQAELQLTWARAVQLELDFFDEAYK